LAEKGQKGMPGLFVEDNSDDVIVRPKVSEDKGIEVGDYVSFPSGRGEFSFGFVSGVEDFNVCIDALADYIGIAVMPKEVVVVQSKGVAK